MLFFTGFAVLFEIVDSASTMFFMILTKFIHKHRTVAHILCFINPRYLVLAFLQWYESWNMVASTLILFSNISRGVDSIFLRNSQNSISLFVK